MFEHHVGGQHAVHHRNRRQRLAQHPAGWALSGLKQAYLDSKQSAKANETDARLKEAWAYADVKLKGSKVK